MKRIVSLLVATLIMMFCSLANAANIKDFPRVAVMQFGNKAIMTQGLQTGDFNLCSEYAIYQLLNSGWFDLVDYEQLSNIAKMHAINMSGLVDQSTAVQLGKFASAQFMVVGNVTGLTTKSSMIGVEASNHGSVGGNKNTVTANVVMRIVDIETGRIVAAGIGSGSSSSTNAEIKFKLYRKSNVTNTNGYGGNPGEGNFSGTDDADSMSSEDNNTSSTNSNPSNTNAGSNTGNASSTNTNVGSTASNNTDNNYGGSGESDNGVGNTTDITTGNSGNDNGAGNTEVPYTPVYPTTQYNEYEEYTVRIGTTQISDVQVRNALGKAVRDAVYGRTGLMTTLNGGKPMKIKTGF